MCTNLTKRLTNRKHKIYGWKAVRCFDGVVRSYYMGFDWVPNTVLSPLSPSSKERMEFLRDYHWSGLDANDLFHFFAQEKDAVCFQLYKNDPKVKIIKVELRGKVFKGVSCGMGGFNGLPALAATKAYWDGKFRDEIS